MYDGGCGRHGIALIILAYRISTSCSLPFSNINQFTLSATTYYIHFIFLIGCVVKETSHQPICYWLFVIVLCPFLNPSKSVVLLSSVCQHRMSYKLINVILKKLQMWTLTLKVKFFVYRNMLWEIRWLLLLYNKLCYLYGNFVICYITLLNLIVLFPQWQWSSPLPVSVSVPIQTCQMLYKRDANVNGFCCCALHIPELSKTNSFLEWIKYKCCHII